MSAYYRLAYKPSHSPVSDLIDVNSGEVGVDVGGQDVLYDVVLVIWLTIPQLLCLYLFHISYRNRDYQRRLAVS